VFELFLKGLIVHLVADWFLQSDWMSENKTDLNHPAAWVHSGLHTAGYLLVFPIPVAIALGFSHLLIDTRKPLTWLRSVVKQNPRPDAMSAFGIWQDQAAHIVLLAIAVLYVGQ
jgi:hypothetical protein